MFFTTNFFVANPLKLSIYEKKSVLFQLTEHEWSLREKATP